MYPYANKFSVKKVSEKGDVLIKVSQEIGNFNEKGERTGSSASGVATIIVSGAAAQELEMVLHSVNEAAGGTAATLEEKGTLAMSKTEVKEMEPADIMKITMTVEQANEVREQMPGESIEDARKKNLCDHLAAAIKLHKLTPVQAQAMLVLAWNKVLSTSALSYPPEKC